MCQKGQRKHHKASFYTKKYRQLRNAESGKKDFSSENSTSVGYIKPNDQS